MRNRTKETGFTLLEMLVVIGLLVIVTTVAVPQFKKCFDDIHLNKSLDDLDSLLQSTRSYYLVMNEIPQDGNPGLFPVESDWAFQANFFGKKTENKNYYNFAIKPWKGYTYDWDCWPEEGYHSAEWVLLFSGQGKNSEGEKNRDFFTEKVSQRYGEDLVNDVTKKSNKNYTYLNFSMVESPKTGKDTNYWNRYY